MGATYLVSARPLPRFIGTCEPCKRPVSLRDEQAAGDHLTTRCPECAQPIQLERIYGTLTQMDCDPRCMGAAGPSCSCACGGSNHGGAWSEEGEMLAGALAAYRARQAALQAERDKRAAAERRRRDRAFTAWLEEDEGNRNLTTELLATDYPDGFLAEMADIVRCRKPLTERQAEAAARILASRKAAAERAAAREASRGEVKVGKQVIEGEIIGTYVKVSDYGHRDREILCIVVDAGSFTVAGTCPVSILMEQHPRRGRWRRFATDREFKGHRVRFTAEVTAGKEPGKGYFKRPTKAEVVS